MSQPSSANAAQIDYWNAAAGETWAMFQTNLDRQIEGLGLEAMRVMAPLKGERVIDIGCGCGQTSAVLAEWVGEGGAVLGVDISAPMLDVARRRPVRVGAASPVFCEIDAQTADLGEGLFDAAYSRFGVMFFADPTAAFSNIRRALRSRGRLSFVCWRSLAENPWMRAPMEAAAAFLPPAPLTDPVAPGPFAFANADRVHGILQAAGFKSITVTPFDARIGGGTVDEALNLSFRVGPLGAALRDNPECIATVTDAVRRVLAAHDTAEGVLMPAAVWIFQAHS